MKALLLRGPNMPFELANLPDPVAGPGEAVARVLIWTQEKFEHGVGIG